MSIVKWDEKIPVNTKSGDGAKDEDLLYGMLSLDNDSSWSGLINSKKGMHTVELRNTFWSAQFLIVIGEIEDMQPGSLYGRTIPKHRNVQISMNGKSHMTIDEVTEMNLAIREGCNVLKNFLEEPK